MTFNLDASKEFKRLSKPPIVEAVIHWQARSKTAFGPDAVLTALAPKLARYTKREPIQQVELQAMLSDEEPTPIVQHTKGWQGIRMKSDDGRYVAQFMRDGLVFSQVREYDRWETFSEAANEAWLVFNEIAMPIDIQQLGVRFINHLAGASPANLQEILRDPPNCPSNLPLSEFVYQSMFFVPGHPFAVRVIKVIQPMELQKSSGLFLDIDVFTTNAIAIDSATMNDTLGQMRRLKNEVFFSLLTDRAIQSFCNEPAT